jgi:hypothetical protein
MEHYLTTAILFKDGHMEGQVLHVGTRAECERVANMVPAIAYNGPRAVEEARLSIMENTDDYGGPLKLGERWQMAAPDKPLSGGRST